jgi:PST family polysaccharide transporter
MNFKKISLINITSQAIYGGLSIVLAWMGFGTWSLIVAQIVQVLYRTVMVLIVKPINLFFLRLNRNSAKELMNYGVGHTLSRIFNTIAIQGDYFVVNKTLGSTALGYYNRAYTLLLVPTNLISTVLDKVMFPMLSKYQDKKEKLSFVYLNISALIALLAMPITIASLLLAEEIVGVVLGSNWGMTVLPFQILVSCLLFRMAYKICDSLVRAIGAVYKRMWVQIVYAVTVIFGALIGKEWGISGVAVATSIAIFVNYVLMTGIVVRAIELKVGAYVRYMGPIMTVSGVIGLASFLLNMYIHDVIVSDIARIVVITGFIGLMYLLFYKVILTKWLPRDFGDFVDKILDTTFDIVKFRKRRDEASA